MQSILDNIAKPSTNIDIIGNIFICDELCDLTFNYKEHSKMNITNKNVLLEIDYGNGSYINYNGGEKFGSEQQKYFLKKIALVGPAKHFIKSFRRNSDNNMGLELILIHESEDKKLYQNISVLLYGSDACSEKKKVQYKLFNEISNNIPLKSEGTKEITVESWSPNDFLPENKSFYTYNSPTNTKLNWIVFKEEVCVPKALIEKYYKYVLDPNKKLSLELRNAPVPKNPENLILFGHQVVKMVSSQCARKIADKVAKEKEGAIPLEKPKEEEKQKEDIKEEEKKEDDKKEVIEDDKKEEDKKEEEKPKEVGISWWGWLLIIILIFVFTIILAFTLKHFFGEDKVGIWAEKYLAILYYPIGKTREYFQGKKQGDNVEMFTAPITQSTAPITQSTAPITQSTAPTTQSTAPTTPTTSPTTPTVQTGSGKKSILNKLQSMKDRGVDFNQETIQKLTEMGVPHEEITKVLSN
jgi:carbonic anhydrase